ncbi:ComEC/Rec2 family competence protein [Ensifer soli]|uniref:ComEC/Rec2 family competence protein n=1 Tax=Ciceribacter sp. sgz301302 TaxID=3342379 RepID=UPI0035B9A2DE
MDGTGQARSAEEDGADGGVRRSPVAAGRPPPPSLAPFPPAPRSRIALRQALARRREAGGSAAEALRRALDVEAAFGTPFLLVPVIVAAGALVWFHLPERPGYAVTAGLLCACCMGLWLARRVSLRVGLPFALLALVLSGMLAAAIETARRQTVLLDQPVTTTIAGTVTGRETDDRGRWRYRVRIDATESPRLGRPPEIATLIARSRHVPFALGERIGGRARLSPPSGPALPGLNDFAFDAYMKGIGATGFFYGAPERRMGPDAAGNGVLARGFDRLATLREDIGRRIRETIGGEAGAIGAALVTAEERVIDRETVEALRQSGLAHVLAISGLNMALAAGTFLVGARTLLVLVPGLAHRFAVKKIAAAGALLMVTFYILISGGAVSAVRSYIMIVIMLGAILVDRPSISLRNVALAGLLIIAVTPSAVTGPGFQMSFAATVALVAGYRRWSGEGPGRDDERPMVFALAGLAGRFLLGLLVSSLIGGFSTLIYSAAHFHRLPAYGLVGNLLAMPLIGIVVMPAGLVAMLLMPFGLDRWPLLVMGGALDGVLALARLVASWGGEIVTGRVPPAAFLLVAAGGILACILRTWLAATGGLLVAAGALIWFLDRPPVPSVVISEDGGLVALVAEGDAALNRDRPPAFVFDQWRRALVLGAVHPPQPRADLAVALPETVKGERRAPPLDAAQRQAIAASLRRLIDEGKPGRFSCIRGQACAGLSRENWRVVVVADLRFLGAACDAADLVVTAAMVRLARCRSAALIVTGRTLRRSGALEILSSPDPASQAMRMQLVPAISDLPAAWSRHRLYDWRTGRFDAALDGRSESPEPKS